MAEVNQAPAQYKQPSRKGKKAWRKNVDVSEIQSGLEEVRQQVVEGGILSEKAADQLFSVDTTGSEEIKKEVSKKYKPLKADEIIAARASALPAIDTRKRKGGDGILESIGKRNKTGNYVSHKELQRLKDVAFSGEKSQPEFTKNRADHDPWAMEPVVEDPRFSFLEKAQPKREPSTLKHKPISLAASGKAFAAVRKPDAGKSYNPAFEDWQNLIAKEGAKELSAEKKRLQDAKDEAEKMEKALAEAARPEPASDEEYESAWESEWEGIASEGEEQAWVRAKRPERKTPAERNKIKRRKEAERKEKWERQMKKRDAQQAHIAELAKEVQRKELTHKRQIAVFEGNASSDESGEEELLRRRRLGKNPIPQAPLEVVLADELQDSLRALRPEGNLLKDRYRNMLVNGKVEARRPAVHKKPRREVTEKWSYKDWQLK